jgi:hypothetical protein
MIENYKFIGKILKLLEGNLLVSYTCKNVLVVYKVITIQITS